MARFLLGAFLSDILYLLHGVCSITSRSTRLENLVLVFFCYFDKVLLDTHYLLFLLQSHGLDWKKGRKHPFNTDTKNLLSFIAMWINRVQYVSLISLSETSWGNLLYQFHHDLLQYKWERNKMLSLVTTSGGFGLDLYPLTLNYKSLETYNHLANVWRICYKLSDII